MVLWAFLSWSLMAGIPVPKCLLQHHSSKGSILEHLAFFILQLLHPYMSTGKTIALTRRSFVDTPTTLFLPSHLNTIPLYKPWSLSSLLSCFLHFIHFASCMLLFFLLFMLQPPWNFPLYCCVLNELFQVLTPMTFSWEAENGRGCQVSAWKNIQYH